MNINKMKKRVFKQKYLLLLVIIIVSAFYSLYFDNIDKNQENDSDWYEFTSIHHYERNTVLEYGQLPLWNPYVGGGYPNFAYPFSTFLSPFFIFILLFGEIIGRKLISFMLIMAGTVGMFFLLSHLHKKSRIGVLFGTLLFSLSSYIPYQLHSANYKMPYFMLLPLIMLFYLKSFKNIKYTFYAAFLLFLVFINGEIVFLFLMLFLLLYSLFRFIYFDRQFMNFRVVKVFGALLVLVILFSMVKLIPLLELISMSDGCSGDLGIDNPECSNTYENLKGNYLSYSEFIDSFTQGKLKDHHTNYLGVIPIILLLASCFFINSRNYVYYLLFGIFTVFLLGTNFFVDLYRFVFMLPVFSSVVKVNKYIPFLLLFSASLIIPFAVSKLGEIKGKTVRKIGFYCVIFLILFSISNQFLTNREYVRDLFLFDNTDFEKVDTFHHENFLDQTRRDSIHVASLQYENVKRGVGTLNWYGVIILPELAIPKYLITNDSDRLLNLDYRGEYYFVSGEGNIIQNYFSPNRQDYSLSLNGSSQMVINQNYNRNWKSSCGDVVSYDGLLSIKNLDGCNSVILRFIPFSFLVGFLISFSVMLISFYLLFCQEKFLKKYI